MIKDNILYALIGFGFVLSGIIGLAYTDGQLLPPYAYKIMAFVIICFGVNIIFLSIKNSITR